MQAPGGINSPMSAAGDTLLVPADSALSRWSCTRARGDRNDPTATPSAAPTSSASPSPSGNTELQISTPNQGDGILFDTKQLTAAAGARVSLTYTNESAIPHDWHLFDGPNASRLRSSAPRSGGPNDVQHVSFTVPSNPVGITSSATCTRRS